MPLREFVALVTSPLIVMLLVASAVSAAVGEVVNAVVIAVMVVMGATLSFWQSARAHRAAEGLRALVGPSASVLRDGRWVDLPHREVVPGDVIRLNAGDLVPADSRIVQGRDLHVQQAALTGESVPAEKGPSPASSASEDVDAPDRIFLGTSVISGTAVAVADRTGRDTVFGHIAAALERPAPETEFDRGTRRFGYFVMRMVVFLVLFVALVNIVLRRDPLDSLLFAIALAVGLTPEYLPMIMTVTLAQGASRMSRAGVIVKRLAAIQNLGSMDVLCSDKTNTLTTGDLVLEHWVDGAGLPSDAALELGALNATHQSGIESGLDAAILALRHPALAEKLDEIPFDFERRRLSVVVLEAGGARTIVTKGAPEQVLEICALTPAGRERAVATVAGLEGKGYRVLAVASRAVELKEAYRADEERDLELAGFLAFIDPPIEGVAETLRALEADGVTLKIVSGDGELVVRHVCGSLGIEVGRVVLGRELDELSNGRLGPLVEATRAFARIRPDQKERILLALKQRGHVVGFLGDGVNDAPSLHAADVGISVERGVDAAKDAADVILRGRGLETLHQGIRDGRHAFGNVMKYLLMGTSSDFGNMVSMAAASMFLPFLPMLPRQILLNDLLYDIAQTAIPTDTVDPSYVRQPRRWDIKLVRTFMFALGPVSSLYDFITFGVLLLMFNASAPLFQTGWFVESLATQTLVVFVIRTAGRPWRSLPSRPLAVLVLSVVAVGIVLPFSPVATWLGLAPLPLVYFPVLALLVLSYLALVEVIKHRIFGSEAMRSEAGIA
jgi:P-type Mg2+ transporter